MKDLYDIIACSSQRRGQNFALATLVRAEGSSYRRPGARMLICEDGQTVGSLSGGCLEQEIAERSRSVFVSGNPLTIQFDTRRRFGCHGQIDIFVEKVAGSFFEELGRELQDRRACTIVTTPKGSSLFSLGASLRSPPGKGREVNSFPRHPFVQEVHPPLRLLICGEGPDSTPMKTAACLLGWEAFEIADVEAVAIKPDSWTAAIVKSHNYARDFAALKRLLPLDLRYVGLMGPRRRRDQLLTALLEMGISMNAGFFAPAGLDLGAETPEEIALSIVTEIQRVFAGSSGESLRERRIPIHLVNERSMTAKCTVSAP